MANPPSNNNSNYPSKSQPFDYIQQREQARNLVFCKKEFLCLQHEAEELQSRLVSKYDDLPQHEQEVRLHNAFLKLPESDQNVFLKYYAILFTLSQPGTFGPMTIALNLLQDKYYIRDWQVDSRDNILIPILVNAKTGSLAPGFQKLGKGHGYSASEKDDWKRAIFKEFLHGAREGIKEGIKERWKEAVKKWVDELLQKLEKTTASYLF